MTPERAKELLPIIQAFAEGKAVQYRDMTRPGHSWLDGHDLCFSEYGINYRIKPVPREFWIAPFTMQSPEPKKNWIKVREVLE